MFYHDSDTDNLINNLAVHGGLKIFCSKDTDGENERERHWENERERERSFI